MTSKCPTMMYADDTVLFYSSKYVDELEAILNEDLDRINNWVKVNKLALNPTKTKYMICGTVHKLGNISHPLCLKLEDHELLQVNTYKYLGVYLDPVLNWKDHVKCIPCK